MSWSHSLCAAAALVIAVHAAELPSTYGNPPTIVVASFVEAMRGEEITPGSTGPAITVVGHRWRLNAK